MTGDKRETRSPETQSPETQSIDRHYGRPDLTAILLDALRAAGKNLAALTPEDLAPVDQFHSRGRPATLELAQRAELAAGMRVLDVGGGLGGPARTIATAFGCAVNVLDITEEYCRAGAELTARAGLARQVSFQQGSALDMPYADGSFDAVWTQHSSMNIADKACLYREIARVLRPGGRLALHEIMAGPVAPVHFPVPWAREAGISHLLPPEDMRRSIAHAGFEELIWIDETGATMDWFRQRAEAARDNALPPLGLHLLLGTDFAAMFANQVRNLNENRIRIVQAVFARS